MQDNRLISRTSRTAAAFETAFGAAPTLFVQAPGRVNLIGEHTDYNDGLVLPCAIDYRTAIAAKPRGDRKVRVVAADYGDALDEYDLDAPIDRVGQPMWANYVRGVVDQFVKRGLPVQGMAGGDVAISAHAVRVTRAG